MADNGFNHERPDESISELVSRLTQEVSDLVNTHMQLARVEIMSDLRHAGRGAGMLGGAGIASYVAAFLASVAAAIGLGELLPLWAGFLIVAAVWSVAGIVLAVAGRRELKRLPQMADDTLEELERDREWMRRRPS